MSMGIGFGKVILLGEHGVVYGGHAIAAPIPLAVEAKVTTADSGVMLSVPDWGLDTHQLNLHSDHQVDSLLRCVLDNLQLADQSMSIKVSASIPRAAGLGASAALAVALIRALDYHYALGLSDDEVNQAAYKCEQIAHGTPSGVDNTVATQGQLLLFKKAKSELEPPTMELLNLSHRITLVVGLTGQKGSTADLAAQVRRQKLRRSNWYNSLFTEMDSLTLAAKEAIVGNDLVGLGELMNCCQGLLSSIRVSTWQLEQLIDIARKNGALGAKLTGAGGGGAMIALCPDNVQQVMHEMNKAGYQAMEVTIE